MLASLPTDKQEQAKHLQCKEEDWIKRAKIHQIEDSSLVCLIFYLD